MTKEERKEYDHQRYLKNKKKMLAQNKQYRETQIGRANRLIICYKFVDKKYNRGECTLTAKWITENIFTKHCAHCGETDWHKIGCNRIDNNLPHTPDNVEPCCMKCNSALNANNLNRNEFGKFIKI